MDSGLWCRNDGPLFPPGPRRRIRFSPRTPTMFNSGLQPGHSDGFFFFPNGSFHQVA